MTEPQLDEINAIRRSATANELTVRLGTAFRRWGFGAFELDWFTRQARVYSLREDAAAPQPGARWLDPFVQHCRVSYTPLVWQSLSPDSSVRRILVWSPWKGLPVQVRCGVAIPVHGPDGGFALVSAPVRRAAAVTIPPENVHSAHSAAIAAYEVMLANQDDAAFGLTGRAVDPRILAALMIEDGEKARVLPGTRH